MQQQVYAAQCNDDNLRFASSSGGIFTLLAETVLRRGGVVFGAAITENIEVQHIAVETPEDLSRLRGSKYVRSRLGDSYQQAKKYLDSGRIVLFTGTPCQIVGLKSYLKKDYVNLFCQDLICHGAPMESVWKTYVNYREAQANSKAVRVSFRDKVISWELFSLTIEFENGSIYTASLNKDPYLRAFLRDLCLGKSCYNCNFKGLERSADLTLADLWGASESCPQLYDGKGISAVFVHTEQGAALWEDIQAQLSAVPISAEAVILNNPAMIKSAREPKNREAFLEALKQGDFAQTVEHFCPHPTKLQRIFRRLLRLLHR